MGARHSDWSSALFFAISPMSMRGRVGSLFFEECLFTSGDERQFMNGSYKSMFCDN
jgi:hypothetical protein